MPEPGSSPSATSGPSPVSPERLRSDLAAAFGDARVIMLHAAPRAIGPVEGGASAIFDAVLDVLGDARTLVLPAFTHHLTDPAQWTNPPAPPERWDAIRAEMPLYDPAETPPFRLGAIPALAHRHPRAVRSPHPVMSLLGIGPDAPRVLERHAVTDPMGPRSPWPRLVEADARVVLLGVGLTRCTLVHYAEHLADVPYAQLVTCRFPLEIEGERHFVEAEPSGGDCSEGFDALFPHLERARVVEHRRVGQARTMSFAVRDLLAVAGDVLRADPFALLCHDDACGQCTSARAPVPERVDGTTP